METSPPGFERKRKSEIFFAWEFFGVGDGSGPEPRSGKKRGPDKQDPPAEAGFRGESVHKGKPPLEGSACSASTLR